MEESNLVTFPRPCYHRIPNFIGAKEAAQRLLELKEFSLANCLFSAPDASLMEARRLVLSQGKTLFIALPHITGYREIKGKELANKAITIEGFKKYGKEVVFGTSPSSKIDLFIQGSVAVDLKGNRLGKGRGYGDREYWELKEKGLLNEDAKVITIVHDCQIVEDFSDLVEENDIKVDYILTPTKILKT